MPSDDAKRRCVFCLDNEHFSEDQILVRDDHFYLCAPLGQLVEGYLVIAPHICGSSLNRLPPNQFAELERIVGILSDFYRTEYGCTNALYYEQGRAGGNARVDPESQFPFHAHLCGLPITCDLHGHIHNRFRRVDIEQLANLPTVAINQPYVYVDVNGRRSVYLAKSPEQREELERFRLTPQLAQLLGLGDQATWRQHPGSEKMERLIRRFKAYQSRP